MYRSCTAVPTRLTCFFKVISSFCPQAGASTADDWRGDELERGFKAKNPFRNGFAIIHFRLSFHRDEPWQKKDCFIFQCIKCWENRLGRYFPCWGLREVTTVSLRWLNTVLRAVSGNVRDGECFNLDKQTWRRKSNGTQKTISQNLLIKILWYLAEFLLLSYFK